MRYLKFDGKVFRHASDHKNKTLAKKKAEKLRRKGYNARVIDFGYAWTVWKRKK